MFPSLGHLIIDPIANIAQQTLPADSEWYLMIESMQNIFPTLIDICVIVLIAAAVISVIKK
ncbi:MAG: hypothetical protein IJE95_07410 [Methanocorpusculum sp.]|nr:hypothetical protein [Methanocorpusculum sp.]